MQSNESQRLGSWSWHPVESFSAMLGKLGKRLGQFRWSHNCQRYQHATSPDCQLLFCSLTGGKIIVSSSAASKCPPLRARPPVHIPMCGRQTSCSEMNLNGSARKLFATSSCNSLSCDAAAHLCSRNYGMGVATAGVKCTCSRL